MDWTWLDAVFESETTKIVLGPAVAFAGFFLSDFLNKKRLHNQVKQARTDNTSRSLSRVLQAQPIIESIYFNPSTGDEDVRFHWEVYIDMVRPELFEYYTWLPKEIKNQINELDRTLWDKRYSDTMNLGGDYNEEMATKFKELIRLAIDHLHIHSKK